MTDYQICHSCQVGMARAGAVVDDDYCMDCKDEVPHPTWRLCSWCSTLTLHSVYDLQATKGRDAYRCCNCDKKTLRCNKCTRGMARGGKWDNDICSWCYDDNATGILGAARRSVFKNSG